MVRDISGPTRTVVFVFIVSKSRNVPNKFTASAWLFHEHCLPVAQHWLLTFVSLEAIVFSFYKWFRNWCNVFSLMLSSMVPFKALCLLRQLKGKTMTAEVSSFISSASLHFAVVFCAWTWWQIMGARSAVQMEAPTATGASRFRVRCTHTCWLSHSAAFHLLSWKQSHYHELQRSPRADDFVSEINIFIFFPFQCHVTRLREVILSLYSALVEPQLEGSPMDKGHWPAWVSPE